MKKIFYKTFSYSIISLLSVYIVWSFYNLFILSYEHWLEPTLFGDSFRLPERGGHGVPISSWIFDLHNEHRILFSKLNSLLEVNFLNLSIGQTALFQNLLLVLLSCGIWTIINQKLFKQQNLKIITTLSGICLILQPWQWENFYWEFQPPWFFINSLLLLATLILFEPLNRKQKKFKYLNLLLIIIPWLAIYSSGQGIALAIALSISSFLKNKSIGIKVSLSTIISLYSYFYLLNYVKPTNHSNYNFDPTFFLAIFFGGIWHGLFLLVLITFLALLLYRPKIKKEIISPLSLPILFSLAFAMMVTLSRSSMAGIRLAGSFRYTTHSLVLGLVSILLLGIIAEKTNKKAFSSVIGLTSFLITFAGFPQTLIFKPQYPNYRGYTGLRLWKHMAKEKKKIRNNFLCMADSSAFKIKNIKLKCNPSPHFDDIGPDYFSNKLVVKPNGWHEIYSISSLNNEKNKIFIEYNIKDILLLPSEDLRLKLSAFAYSKIRGQEKFFIVANYESNKQKIIRYVNKDYSYIDLKNHVNLLNSYFIDYIPLYSEGFLLRNITLETRNNSSVIVKNSFIKKLQQ